MTETQLLKKVITYLKGLEKEGLKVFYQRRQAGGFNSAVGIFDLYIVINGKHYEIELKSPQRPIRYNAQQLRWKEKFENLNIECLISNNFEEIKTFIEGKL